MSNEQGREVEVNIGPQINCDASVAVGSIEINDNTELVCKCSKVTIINVNLNNTNTLFLQIQRYFPLCFALGVGFGSFLDFLINKCCCCVCGKAAAGGALTLKSFLIGLLVISVTTGVGKMLDY